MLGRPDGKEDTSFIYTDGSHAMDKTLGHSWIHRIFVRVDVKVKKAFDVELICILIAN